MLLIWIFHELYMPCDFWCCLTSPLLNCSILLGGSCNLWFYCESPLCSANILWRFSPLTNISQGPNGYVESNLTEMFLVLRSFQEELETCYASVFLGPWWILWIVIADKETTMFNCIVRWQTPMRWNPQHWPALKYLRENCQDKNVWGGPER